MFNILIPFFSTNRHTKPQRSNKGAENPNKPIDKLHNKLTIERPKTLLLVFLFKCYYGVLVGRSSIRLHGSVHADIIEVCRAAPWYLSSGY